MRQDARFLKNRSVSARTRQRYEQGELSFRTWARGRRLAHQALPGLDAAMEAFVNALFFQGQSAGVARYAIWGTAFVRGLLVTADSWPRTLRALRGFRLAAPEAEKAPIPWEAVVAMAAALATGRTSVPKVPAEQTARAMLLQFDTYLRPSELLALAPKDILQPTGAVRTWSILVAQAPMITEGARPTSRWPSAACSGRARRRRSSTTTPCSSASRSPPPQAGT